MHTKGLVFVYKVAIQNGRSGYWSTMLKMVMVLAALIGLGIIMDSHLIDDGLIQDIIRVTNFLLIVMLCFLPVACCEAYEIARNELKSER